MKPRLKYRTIGGRGKLLHRALVEQSIERPLEPTEIVHHKNGDTLDNRLDNLQIMTIEEHARHHISERFDMSTAAVAERKRLKHKRYQAAHAHQIAARKAAYYQTNKERWATVYYPHKLARSARI